MSQPVTPRKPRERTLKIRDFLLRNVEKEPGSVAAVAAQQFGVSRRAISRHLRRLVDDGLLTASGTGRARQYSLAVTDSELTTVDVSPSLAEDRAWEEILRPHFEDVRKNVRDICHHGFTEMLNNVIDHSGSSNAAIQYRRTPIDISIAIGDQGVGIWRKIMEHAGLDDEQHAILELTKGKFTTDPDRHSGEGIYFSSRMFDFFGITSHDLSFSFAPDGAGDWLIEGTERRTGTDVYMRIDLASSTTTKEVFDRHTSDFQEFGFDKTTISVALLKDSRDDRVVSRSQAKRLLSRIDKFREVILNFEGIGEIGQAFADEVFRVFARHHPEVRLIPIRTTEPVEQMIARAKSAAAPEGTTNPV